MTMTARPRSKHSTQAARALKATARDILKRLGLLAPLRRGRTQLQTYRRIRYQARFEERVYRDFLSQGSLCFDIGAHTGDKTKVFLRCGARVVAVEPLPDCVDRLARRFGGDEVVLVPEAIGREPGSATLHIGENRTMSTLSTDWIDKVREGRLKHRSWPQSVDVSVTTLDDLIERFGVPDFVKIDVEGFEIEVLAGLSRAIPALCFEFTPEDIASAQRCIDRLAELGPYVFNFSYHAPLALELVDWEPPERFGAQLEQLSYDHGNRRWGDVFARLT